MKKGSVVIGLFLLIGLFLVSGVFAQATTQGVLAGIAEFLDNLATGLEPIFQLFLGETPSGILLFSKVLLFTLITIIIWIALSRVGIIYEYPFAHWVIAIVAAVLGVRYFGEATVQTLILPYNVTAISIAAILPFLIYFWFVYFFLQSRIARRIAWILFAVVFIGLWISRSPEIAGPAEWVYPITAGAAILMFLFDGTIMKTFRKMKLENMSEAAIQRREELLLQRKQRILDLDIDTDEKERRIKKIDKELVRLHG